MSCVPHDALDVAGAVKHGEAFARPLSGVWVGCFTPPKKHTPAAFCVTFTRFLGAGVEVWYIPPSIDYMEDGHPGCLDVVENQKIPVGEHVNVGDEIGTDAASMGELREKAALFFKIEKPPFGSVDIFFLDDFDDSVNFRFTFGGIAMCAHFYSDT